MKTVSVMNLGCKVNAYESEAIVQQLEEEGYTRVPFGSQADLAMIFTCAVTNEAARKSRQMIHRARRSGCRIVAVAGCYAQIDPDAVKDADIVVGSVHKKNLPGYVHAFERTGERILDVGVLDQEEFEPLSMVRFADRTRAFLKIEDGCNQFCSYCVIPYARGRERSMAPDCVIEEARRIAVHHKEIVLTGIHTGRYGREYGVSLAGLLRRILNEVPELERLRISSIEVTELNEEFLSLMEENPRIARHLHIPLQSGCDRILEAMRRPYRTDEFLERITDIRRRMPGISISTDLIVGFPGETDADFEETVSFLKTCAFSFLHVFPFSVRSGTAAEKMDHQIHAEVKKQRAKICLNLSEELYDTYKREKIGSQVRVLMERSENGMSSGHSSEYLEVFLKEEMEKSTMADALITGVENHRVYARRIYETE